MSDSAEDPRGYYQALRLPAGAGAPAIEAAYKALLEEWQLHQDLPRYLIQDAYRLLSDPAQKAAYDALCARQPVPEADVPSRFRSLALSAILTVLLLQAGLVFPGFLLPAPASFQAGDFLIHASTRSGLGQVLEREYHHRFPGGRYAPGYLMRLEHGATRWYPAGDLERHYRRLGATQSAGVRGGLAEPW